MRSRPTLATLFLLLSPTVTGAPDIDVLEDSVVRVVTERDDGGVVGTGFVLNDRGIIATNSHVVEDARNVSVLFGGVTPSVEFGTVIWSSAALDLALIDAGNEGSVPLRLAERLPPKGANVYALGFPGEANTHSPRGVAVDATVTKGVLSRVFEGSWTTQELTLLQHDAAINPGSSGGSLARRMRGRDRYEHRGHSGDCKDRGRQNATRASRKRRVLGIRHTGTQKGAGPAQRSL